MSSVDLDADHNGRPPESASIGKRRREIVVKLVRDKWPSNLTEKRPAEEETSSTASQISAVQPPEPTQDTARRRRQQPERPKRRQQVEALVHTDQLPASSPLLHVRSSLHHLSTSDERLARLQLLGAHQDPQESRPSRTAVLSSSGPSMSLQPRESRLVVLDLQVTSSSATLTWSLALHPASDLEESGGGGGDTSQDATTVGQQQVASGEQRRSTASAALDGEHNGGRSNHQDGGVTRSKRHSIRLVRAAPVGATHKAANVRANVDDPAKLEATNEAKDDDDDENNSSSNSNKTTNEGRQRARDLLRLVGSNGLANNQTSSMVNQLVRQQLAGSPAQPLGVGAASGQPLTRRPPARRESTAPVATTEASSPSPLPYNSQAPRRHQRPPGRQLQLAAAPSEPPMIRTPSVPLNRLAPITSSPSESNTTTTTSTTSTTTTSTSTTLRPTSSSTTERPQESSPEESSKWLVRLRRFGSNEVDIVKIVVNNPRLAELDEARGEQPLRRYISFKNLEPASGYELCVESASPNQQVGDKYQILDANHYLKCHDTSDVELANSTSSSGAPFGDAPVEGAAIARRSPQQESSQQEAEPSGRIQSLCKEFFTLPQDSNDTLTFGPTSSSSRQLVVPVNKIASSASNNNNNKSDQTAPSRRPKSLNNALRSHMELLEINDLGGLGGPNSLRDGTRFEVLASRDLHPMGGRPAIAGLDHYRHRQAYPAQPSPLPALELPPNQAAGSGPQNSQDYMSLSLLPIVGCVFALIFIITLANILLSAINCTNGAERGDSAARARARRLRRQQQGASISHLNHHHHHNQGYYSESDHSAGGGSQSRIVVVGNRERQQEPFAASSAYFEVPSARNSTSQNSLSSSSNGRAANNDHKQQAASSFLAARFPLGPSFEGDERHNADMVGLARKNYDNFINNIYNSTDSRPPPPRAARTPDGYDERELEQHEAAPASPHEPNGERPQSRHQQRLRFDKINPIYNMELACQTATNVRASQVPLRSPVSTFGHSNAHHQQQSTNWRSRAPRSRSADNDDGDDEEMGECAMCLPTGNQPAEFTCCLDRQKQRFERQQEQLGRVVTKSGSLVPQPFINPTGPSRCGSPSCQAALQTSTNEGSLASSTSGASAASNRTERDQHLEEEELAQVSVPNTSAEAKESPAPNYLMFGDEQDDAVPVKRAAGAVVSIKSAAADHNQHQAMNKTDFNQRRNELASKLHLVGMLRPGE